MAQYAIHPQSAAPVTVSHRSPTAATPGAAPPATGPDASQPSSVQHKRVYQACIPCRRRKVRCDLGSVDNPHDPPCVRCRRESKECFFSATRRKRKTDDGRDVSEDPDVDEYVMRNGRKRLHTSGSSSVVVERSAYSDVPLTPGGSTGRKEPLRRPEASRLSDTPSHQHAYAASQRAEFGIGDEPNTQLNNPEAQNVMRRGMYGPHDALDLLYKAATDDHKREEHSIATAAMPPQSHLHPSTLVRKHSGDQRVVTDARQVKMEQPIDPELTRRDLSGEPGYVDAVKAWTRFRFVRAGWFTAQEAIDYIDYYYEYLSPLTPISPPTFRNPASHATLLTEEPILTVTLLTIASRYRRLPGTGGQCRSNAIHEQLWTYLRGMIERCLWGQEAFGGGLCTPSAAATVSGDPNTSSTAPWRGLRKGSLRTLGTIESLMILTEWHPRALHFPPAEAIDELMLPSYDANDLGTDEDGNQRPAGGVGGRRIDSWLEPAWRSDRMCWMLLSTAMGLAYELGVFDDIEELVRDGAITRPEYEEETYRQRAARIKRLLVIYLTQLAGRLGWTNMVSEGLRTRDHASRRRPTSVEGATPGTNPSSLSNAFNYIPDLELDDQIIHCWAGISNAMHIGNAKLFRTRKHTTEIITNGKYIDLLKEFQPMLRDWWKEFQRFPLPQYIRHILTIEYEYVRIYINSLSLQAVVERCASNAAGNTTGARQDGGSAAASAAQLSPQTQNYYGKLPLGHLGGFGVEDQEYVREVVEGSRNLLRTVVDGLLPGDYLKHAPVRTYFRIISGAMFLLKTFALGAPRSDVKVSIDLMDSTVEALRNCVVDDVHLGIRFADLLESLTSRLRNRFIQAPTMQQGTSTDGRSPNPPADLLTMNGSSGAQFGGPDAPPNWSTHSSKLRDSLNGHDRAGTPSNANISATPYDPNLGNFPYPSGSASVLGPSTPAALDNGMGDDMFAEWNNPGNEMWYLPAGPSFFQNMDSGVAMTAEGVSVGGMDLLDYMTMDSQFALDGGNTYS